MFYSYISVNIVFFSILCLHTWHVISIIITYKKKNSDTIVFYVYALNYIDKKMRVEVRIFN
jgi:hypothetical protein